MDFEAYGLNPRLQHQLRKVGVDKFFPVQAQCFEKVGCVCHVQNHA